MLENRKMADETVKQDTDDLICNRFDMIYKDDYERFSYSSEGRRYVIDVHCEGPKAVVNTWGKKFPQHIVEAAVSDIFQKYPGIRYIELNRAGNDYHGLLDRKNDIRIPIPSEDTDLLARLKPKHRYNLKRAKRLIEEAGGELTTDVYEKEIPNGIVDLYFVWKRATHGIQYGMTPEAYLRKYYVTHAMVLRAGETAIGIAFYCVVNKTAYLENFSYDMKWERFSAGYLTYVMLLKELVKSKCGFLYLGGGEYIYKKHFGAEETIVYSGVVYNQRVFDELNLYFLGNGIERIAIYGLGAGGRAFLKIKDRLHVELTYGIDRDVKEAEEIPVYTREEKLPEVDAVLITLHSHSTEIEKFLDENAFRFFYWDDLAKFGVNQTSEVNK